MNFMKIVVVLINFFSRTANYIRDFYNKYDVYIGLVLRIVLGMFIVSFLFGKCHRRTERKTLPSDTVFVFKTDTAFVRDTVTRILPRPYAVAKTDTMYVRDTVIIREHKFYKDSLYEAWVSGYEPSLDSIRVFPITRTITNTVTNTVTQKVEVKKNTPFGLGVQVGCGYPNGFYVGVGLSYNFLRF